MKRFIGVAFAIPLALFVLSVAPAAAQNTYPYQQPMFRPGWQTPLSPYLNMLIPGNPAVNYYALVEPQFQRRQYRNLTNQTLQALVSQLPPAPGALTEEELDAPMRATGHPTAFNYTGSFFNSNMVGQPIANAFPQSRTGPVAGPIGPGGRSGMGAGMGGMMGGRGGGGTWPNMRPRMGMPGR